MADDPPTPPSSETFTYKGMTSKELREKNLTIDNPWEVTAGDMVMTRPKGAFVRPNCDNPRAKPTICDPKLRTMNVHAACGSDEDIYYFSPVRT